MSIGRILEREDHASESNNSAFFLAVEPLVCFWQVWVRSQCTKLDFAVILKELVDELDPEADKLVW
jgi:hypothetical protein